MISRNIFLALPLCRWVFCFVFFIYIFLTLLTTSILLFWRLIPQVFNSSCSSLPNLTSVCLRLSVSYRSSPQCVVSLCVFPTVGLCQALVHTLCVSWVSLFPLLEICFFLVDFFPLQPCCRLFCCFTMLRLEFLLVIPPASQSSFSVSNWVHFFNLTQNHGGKNSYA